MLGRSQRVVLHFQKQSILLRTNRLGKASNSSRRSFLVNNQLLFSTTTSTTTADVLSIPRNQSSTTMTPSTVSSSSASLLLPDRSNAEILSIVAHRVQERKAWLVNGEKQIEQKSSDFFTKALPAFRKYVPPTEDYMNEHFPVQSINWDTVQNYYYSTANIDTTTTNFDPSTTTNSSSSSSSSTSIQTTWMGHSTILVQMDNYTILTDPVFSERCSPYGKWVGPKRLRPPACTIQQLMSQLSTIRGRRQMDNPNDNQNDTTPPSPLDVVVISHNHYDHLDYTSVRDIVQYCTSNSLKVPIFIVPLGLKKWFHSYISNTVTIYEMDWYESITLPIIDKENSTIQITCLPMRHWSNRIMLDRDQTLWCGYRIITTTSRSSTSTSTATNKKSFLFTGDTAWYDEMEEIIGKQYGPYDVAAIPIGAYEPWDFMKEHHINPIQAVQMKDAIKAKYAIPIHYGTFPLTTEPVLEPIEQLQALMQDRPDHDSFVPWYIGETKTFPIS